MLLVEPQEGISNRQTPAPAMQTHIPQDAKHGIKQTSAMCCSLTRFPRGKMGGERVWLWIMIIEGCLSHEQESFFH